MLSYRRVHYGCVTHDECPVSNWQPEIHQLKIVSIGMVGGIVNSIDIPIQYIPLNIEMGKSIDSDLLSNLLNIVNT